MHFCGLMHQWCLRVRYEQILQVVVHMRWFIKRCFAWNIMAVDHEWTILALMPGMEQNIHDSGFLHCLASG